MKLSTKGQYAVSALIEIAIKKHQGPITLSELAASQGISLSYAEQLFAALRKRQLVRGTRGPGGGFTLARSAGDITVAEIISAVYEKKWAVGPVGEEHLPTSLWNRLDQRIDDFLANITLGQVIAPTAVEAPRSSVHQRDGEFRWNKSLPPEVTAPTAR